MAYTSKYSGAEIDQRLLQNYYDDLVAAGYSGTKAEYLSAIRSLLQFDKANISAGNVKYHDDKVQGNTTVQAKLDEIVNKVVTEAEENDIILLHDCYDSSVDAALRIIDILQKKGFEFVTVDQLIMN